MSNVNESKYKYFDKKFLVFPYDEYIGKRVFYANNYTALVSDIESGDFDRTGLIEEVKPYEQKPFKIRDEVDDILWEQLAYCDPDYEAKVAYSQGKQIQVRLPNTDEWLDTKEPAWAEASEYRVKPVVKSTWYVHPSADEYGNCIGHPFYKDTSNKKFVEFEGTKEECDKWIKEHTPKTRRYTNRELARWCADNKGQVASTDGLFIVGWCYISSEDNEPVRNGIRIREWGSDEWHEPLVEVKE